MIKLELIRIFLAVTEFGNIAEASAKMGRTPSAISMSLKQLEALVGGSLFERDRKNKLTPLGAYVDRIGRAELARYERAIRSIRAFAHNEIGRVDIACVPSVAATLIPQAISSFLEKFPSVEISIRDTDSAAVEAAVESEVCEIGIAGTPKGKSTLEFQPLFRDPLVAVVPKDHPLAKRRRKLAAADLAAHTFISNGAAASIVRDEFKELSDQARIVAHTVASLLAMVRSGAGITILPALTVVDSPPDLVTLRLEDKVPPRVVGFLSREACAMTPAAASFRDFFVSSLRNPKLRNPPRVELLV